MAFDLTLLERASVASARSDDDAGPTALMSAGVGLVVAVAWSLLMRSRRKTGSTTLGS